MINEEVLKELKLQTKLLQHIAIQSTIAAHCNSIYYCSTLCILKAY